MNKSLLAACAAISLATLGAPAHAAPSVALSASITAHATPPNLPETLAQMRHQIAVLQTEVSALQGQDGISVLRASRTPGYDWYYGPLSFMNAS
jgi:hypothetical protein